MSEKKIIVARQSAYKCTRALLKIENEYKFPFLVLKLLSIKITRYIFIKVKMEFHNL